MKYITKKLNQYLKHPNKYSEKVIKPIFTNVFNMYGSFEKRFTETRFILYLIQIIFLLLYMLKRIYFGGFGKLCYVQIS